MRVGAIAILDALGFKGIWVRESPESVLEKMADLARTGREMAKAVGEAGGVRVEPFAIAFSDTIIMGASLEGRFPDEFVRRKLPPEAVDEAGGLRSEYESSFRQYFSLIHVSLTAARIAATAIEAGDPTLLFRGAIAVGNFERGSDAILGPAIDEAAEMEKLPQAAAVCFSPSAHMLLDEEIPRLKTNDFITPDDDFPGVLRNVELPVHGGVVRTHVVNPLFMTRPKHVDDFISRALSAFSRTPSISVWVKRQNTDALFRQCARALKKHSAS